MFAISPTSEQKQWKDLKDDEKIERLRNVINQMQNRMRELEQRSCQVEESQRQQKGESYI